MFHIPVIRNLIHPKKDNIGNNVQDIEAHEYPYDVQFTELGWISQLWRPSLEINQKASRLN